MFNIKTYNNISPCGLDQFDPASFVVGPDVTEPHAYLLRSHKLHDHEFPASLNSVARAGAGVNNIPIDLLTHKGVVVFNTPGANANAVKELVAAALFLGSRNIVEGILHVQQMASNLDHDELVRQLEAEKKRFTGNEIAGKTLGIIGLGAIGSLVANMALELGMKVAGFDPAISVHAAWRLSSRVENMESLEDLLKVSDFVSLHVPAIDATHHLIDEASLQNFKSGATLLNFARDEVVDVSAVVEALNQGRLSRYITDFPSPGLMGRDDTLLLPHIGASTREAEQNCAVMAADQLIDFLCHGNINNSVNFPQTRMARNGGFRLTFCNENIPRVLGSVLTVLADRNINVIDMVNKSQGDIAYNIIDVEGEPTEGVIAAISAAAGVIRVRVV
jgi:D-3-phosphoglycerate dehydrogenase